MASQEDLEQYYKTAVELARKAGAVANEALHRDKQVQVKVSSSDLVTETDKKIEEIIFIALREKYPTHKFIGEETTADNGGCPELTDDPTWMVDPIDGTSNFVHRFPFSAVSIGLAINKESVVGVVYNFILDQLYAAKKGGGATLNGKPIHVTKCKELPEAFLMTELGNSRKATELRPKLDAIYSIAVEPNPVCGIRCSGSAAVNACMVASGSADGYFEYGIHCWDIAASVIIVREAGGVVLYPTGEPLDLMRRGVLCAATTELAMKIVPHMKHIEYGKDQTD